MKRASVLIACAAVLSGCEEPQPRGVAYFMEDEAALEAMLVRCDQDKSLASKTPECSNASRAAERLQLIEERALMKARQEAFERERAEYRARLDRERELRRQAEAAAEEARLRALTGGAEFTAPKEAAEAAGATAGEAAGEPAPEAAGDGKQ